MISSKSAQFSGPHPLIFGAIRRERISSVSHFTARSRFSDDKFPIFFTFLFFLSVFAPITPGNLPLSPLIPISQILLIKIKVGLVQTFDTSHLIFICAGQRSTLGLRFPVHRNPPAFPTHFHPDAFKLAPFSLSRIYVTSRLYPIALAALHAAAYSMEQAFLVPSVHRRFTSNVHPSSR